MVRPSVWHAVNDAEPTAAAGRRHRRVPTWVKVAVPVGLVAGLLAALVLVVLLGGEEPREVTVDEARQRLGTSTTGPGTTGTTAGPDTPTRPTPGVYLYRGEGTEDTSFPPLVEQQGPDMPATITWDGPDCFTFRIDYNSNHWQSWDLCLTAEGLEERGGTTFARRDFTVGVIDSEATFACDPPAPWLPVGVEPGDTWDVSCTGTNSTIDGETVSAGTTTYVGTETLVIGGVEVEAHHLSEPRTLSGAQTGDEQSDLWLAVDDLLPLKAERRVDVSTSTPIGAVDYSETSSWELTDLSPT